MIAIGADLEGVRQPLRNSAALAMNGLFPDEPE